MGFHVLACEWPDTLPVRLCLVGAAVDDRLLPGRLGCWSPLASCSLHAMAFKRRIKLASLTRRRNNGSVVSVRNVSLRIFEYAGEAPR